MTTILKTIQSPNDLRKLTIVELKQLSTEIRHRIIRILSTNPTGGHLSSNLGIVELTLGLHYIFNAPKDKFIFDTSHQTYVHKIITGRNERLHTIRQLNGLCGFSSPSESEYDHFYAGHAATALSLGLGLAKARDLQKDSFKVLPILGDAAFTCGLTLEALNNIPKDLKNFLVILNDNEMSISPSVGSWKSILKAIAKQKSPSHRASFFEQFGLRYIGPINGHDVKEVVDCLSNLPPLDRPTIVHALTVKGKGMDKAMQLPTTYHGVKPFHINTGEFLKSKSAIKFPKIFGKHILKLAEQDPSIVAITPAMPAGSCLTQFMEKYPDRCLDVGIAEGHSVTFSGGISYLNKHKVVASVYATFLQRALDNVFQDVCLQKLPVVFALDRASLSAPDGSTHHGIYDISFLNAMPNMVICQPRDGHLLKELLESAFTYNRPVAIRYPNLDTFEPNLPIQHRPMGRGEVLKKGSKLLIVALGHKVQDALILSEELKNYGIDASVVDPIFVKPLDTDLFFKLLSSHKYVVTIEEHSLQTGLGSIINNFIVKSSFTHLQVLNFGVPEAFIEHGAHSDVIKSIGLDPDSMLKQIVQRFALKQVKSCQLQLKK